MKLSVIVATYEWPEALGAVLGGLADQSDREFEIVVADDGSGQATAALVEDRQERFAGRLSYVRQNDEGYRLARVRNVGSREASGDFLVFIDGDVIPRRHFVRAVKRSMVPGWFVAGKRLRLDRELSARVLGERITIGRWSLARFALLERRRVEPLNALTPRDRRRPGRDGLPDFVPHAGGYGFLLGVARTDFERVNGYDMRYEGWGAEDVDMGVRLNRLGLRCGWPGPQSTLLHLWHETRKGSRRRPNTALLAEAVAADTVEAVQGIRQLSA
jgi:glycosyltransferase involved in cell wall biosynthesis